MFVGEERFQDNSRNGNVSSDRQKHMDDGTGFRPVPMTANDDVLQGDDSGVEGQARFRDAKTSFCFIRINTRKTACLATSSTLKYSGIL